jgi:DNA-binding GntR family transcriptional regulator
LRVFSELGFAYKPQQVRVFADTCEPARIPLLWCSRWREASPDPLILIMPQRGLLVPEIDVKKQLKLLRMRREVEWLVCRSAAKSATPQEHDVFAQLAAEFKEASKRNDDVSFVRLDREFNELCLIAPRNEFAEAAMPLMHSLARRFWYFHYKQAADIPEMARLHGAVAKAIAEGNVDAAGEALDALLDNIEEFTRATLAEV